MEDHYSCDTKWWHYLVALSIITLILFAGPWLMFVWMLFAGAPGNP